MEQELRLEQRQQLTARQELSLQLLQMDAMELSSYLHRQAEENPVLDLQDRPVDPRTEDLLRRLRWSQQGREQGSDYYYRDSDGPSAEPASDGAPTLQQYLTEQAGWMDLPQEVATALHFLIGCVDQNGYLPKDILSSLRQLPYSTQVAHRALGLLRGLDPAGVGACDLAQCLLLQLERQGMPDALTTRIVQGHLADLATGRFSQVASATGATGDEVAAVYRRIRSLDPRPGSGFASGRPTQYIIPDVIVSDGPDGPVVSLCDVAFPTVRVDTNYIRMIEQTDDPQAMRFVADRARRAQWLCTCVQNRSQTLLRVSTAIVQVQSGAFGAQRAPLVPLRLCDLAQMLSLHESTVSRAIRGKYLQCRHGVFELRSFLSGAVGEQQQSTDAIQAALRALIEAEDPAHPLSDQKLCDALLRQGLTVSRRTVTKYRERLGIANSPLRKRSR